MRSQFIISIIVIIVVVIGVGWSLYRTSGSQAEINAKVSELTPENEKKEINVTILKQKAITDALSRQFFGTPPKGDDPNVGRSNPFEGI